MALVLFDHKLTTVTTVLVATLKLGIMGNRNRVSLLFSADTTPSVNWGVYTTENPSTLFLRLNSPFTFTMLYRDFGPLVKEAMWLSSNPAPSTITITEILLVPNSR